MNANIRTIGGSIGAAVMSSIVTATAHAGGLPQESGYTRGYGVLTIAAAAAAVAAILVPSAVRTLSPGAPAETVPPAAPGLAAGAAVAADEPEREEVEGARNDR
jgi:hypothetical protein